MKLDKINLNETGKFSKLFLDYIHQNDQLRSFYSHFPQIEDLDDFIKSRNFSPENRKILCQDLQVQYENIQVSDRVKVNLQKLADTNTFTITTGHQLNLLTGPLYFIYKIASVIKICHQLKERYPDYHFVPVYWMASEDHDFEEISYFKLNGKKYQWNSEQTGAVGHFETKELKALLETVSGIPDFFVSAYLKSTSLAEAVRKYVNTLFGDHGLVVVDADSSSLKYLFKEVMKSDIIENKVAPLVESETERLKNLGYNTQVNARKVNFFYLKDNLRNRIEKDGNIYRVVDTDISFDEEEMRNLIDSHPECLSPNVILRPVYQEIILPNLAYIGGPSELGYWLQLKSTFDNLNASFPLLMPRNFAMVLSKSTERKIKKTELSISELFKPKESLKKFIALRDSKKDLHLNGQLDQIMTLFDGIKKQAEQIDITLGPHVAAQKTRTQNMLEGIEKKFIRAEKRHHSDRIGQVEVILEELFPNGGLQERTANFLEFYLTDSEFIDKLIRLFQPFDFRFNVLSYGD